MKKLFLFLSTWIYIVANAQVGIGTTTPASSAQLEVSSTVKGVLITRMTTAQRIAIVNPVQGLLIFNTETNCFETYTGSVWMQICGVEACSAASAATTEATHDLSVSNQITWKWFKVPGVTLYKYNTVNDYNTATSIGTDTSYIQAVTPGAVSLFVWAYNACGVAAPVQLTATITTCPILTINHSTATGAAVNTTIVYTTVQSTRTGTARCWLEKDLGATQVATSLTDATQASAGWYWRFGQAQGFTNDGTTTSPAWTTGTTPSGDWPSAADPCTIALGAGWRLPTITEWTSVLSSFGSSNIPGAAYASELKLHFAGSLFANNGQLNSRGQQVFFASSTRNSDPNLCWTFMMDNSPNAMIFQNMSITNTNAVRCIK